MSAAIAPHRAKPDQVLIDIVDYVTQYKIKSALAYATARHCLIDTLGCGLEALEYPACTKLLGPLIPGTVVPHGAKVPGTQFQLDPVQAAFNIGTLIRWLDFNDTWLAAEWGHPSDNLGGILATADWLSRTAVAHGKKPLLMKDVLTAMIKAHEIQGCLALENSFNKVGLDHVVLVKVASTAVVAQMLGLTREEIINARRMYERHGWPVIDVTRRSIEETAATIIKMLHDKDAVATRDGIPKDADGTASITARFSVGRLTGSVGGRPALAKASRRARLDVVAGLPVAPVMRSHRPSMLCGK